MENLETEWGGPPTSAIRLVRMDVRHVLTQGSTNALLANKVLPMFPNFSSFNLSPDQLYAHKHVRADFMETKQLFNVRNAIRYAKRVWIQQRNVPVAIM